jgi:GDPmannose 4,6-dehydratase
MTTKTKSPNKSAIIIGVTGQDGSYLSELLLGKGYSVIGVKRRSSTDTSVRLTSVMNNPNFHLVEGDITDYASMSGVFAGSEHIFYGAPHEVYNLAAQSHVGTSFEQPLATWDSTACGVINILEVIRQGGYIPTTRFYQASTSEMFGDKYRLSEDQMIQDETVEFNPRSPYSVAKVAAHNAVNLYRDAYGLFGCCGILFNHESPRRGENFVTRKITKWVAEFHRWYLANEFNTISLRDSVPESIFCGMDSFPKLRLGNLDAKRDWGHAADYVRSMHMMLQHNIPDDYVIATGKSHSVADFCEAAFGYINIRPECWRDFVYVDPAFIRPSEVPHLQGVADKAKQILGWEPQVTFRELVEDMMRNDIAIAAKE